jgi:transposase
MPKNHNPKPPYPPEFRQQMVELVRAGRRPSELAKEFGCHETSIAGWVAGATAATPSLSDLPPKLHESERAELIALRKEARQIKMERDILAKATAWFANKGDQTDPDPKIQTFQKSKIAA